jgi:hypothetical protein
MSEQPEVLTFNAWQRATLFDRAQRPDGKTRLESIVTLTLTDVETNQSAGDDVTFTLLSAGDVAGLKPNAIKHVAPAPFARDAETTKFVHIDLWEPDLPWRYTPLPARNQPTASRPDNLVIPPWLVLLVGLDTEIRVEAGVVMRLDDALLRLHDLANSHQWAHTQWDGQRTIARILSPRGSEPNADGKPLGLLPQHEYVAVLVPAFNSAGAPMWRVDGESVTRDFGPRGVLLAFHAWRFWTAEAGDFETLAAALRLSPAADVGKATLHYRRTVVEEDLNIQVKMEVRGAITSLQTPATPNQVELDAVITDVNGLNDEFPLTIGLPPYGRPWLPDPDAILAGWPQQLTDDPCVRSIAGLGVWMGVEAQEALINAAVQQAGALREAGQRINHLALGLWTSKRLWDRRMPTDKNARLRILGPMMARMTAADGGIVLDRVTGPTSTLTPAIFSSAAQRVLRGSSSATRQIVDGFNYSMALEIVNTPDPLPSRAPVGLPHVDAVAADAGFPPLEEILEIDDAWIADVIDELWQAVLEGSQEFRQNYRDLLESGNRQEIPLMRQALAKALLERLTELLQTRLAEHALPCEGGQIIHEIGRLPAFDPWEYYALVLEDGLMQSQFYAALWLALRRCMARRICPELIANVDLPIADRERFCDDLLATRPPPRPHRRPVHLDALSDALYTALDPRRDDAPARLRVCARLSGVDCTRLVPVEYAIGLDFPTWELLRQYDKEWLLPGVGALEMDTITALQTNPAFIDAYMVGVNSQFMSEMRWRDLAVDRTSTPLRMFWGQVNYATQAREADIEPLAEWAKAPANPIGDLSHQSIQPSDPANASGSRLVIVFRSDLFRRYPATLVYLVRPKTPPEQDPQELYLDELLKQTPDLTHAANARADREFFGPIFAGTITPQITFFAFDVAPEKLDQYWLVLDEPPAELRFRNYTKNRPLNTTNGATVAQSALDRPTRVAISGKKLEEQGNQP